MPDKPTPTLDQQLLTMRIIHGALCMGVVMGTAILANVRLNNNQPPAPDPIISYLGVAFAAVAIVLSFVVPGLVIANGRQRWVATMGPESNEQVTIDETPLWGMYQIGLIVGMSFLEGAAFFQAIAYSVEGLPFSLGVAAALLLVMLMRWPTRAGIENWVSAQREQITRMRQDQ